MSPSTTMTKCLVLSALLCETTAFVQKTSSGQASSGQASRVGWTQYQPSQSRHFGTIYSPDGTVEDVNSDEPSPYQSEEHTPSLLSLLETLQAQYKSSLASVACAFAPPGHAIQPKDVETVHVLDIGKSHIEINAVLCEAQGCVSVSVPVEFPIPCQDGEDMELCVLDNISRLSTQAENVIATAEWKEVNYEEVEALERIRKSLLDRTNVAYPDWWVVPSDISYEMKLECRTLSDLLDEADFRDEIDVVAKEALQTAGHLGADELCQSGVVDVGPAGILMRAHLKTEKTMDDESGYKIVDVQIPFVTVSTSESDVRAAILALISDDDE